MLGPQDVQKENIDSPPSPPADPGKGNIISTGVEAEEYAKKKIVEILGDDPKVAEDFKVQALLDYAENKGAKTAEDILWEVRYLANHLGTPGYGESRLSFLYEYVYLLKESDTIKDKMKKMEVFNNGKTNN
jgi:hypothetical protein